MDRQQSSSSLAKELDISSFDIPEGTYHRRNAIVVDAPSPLKPQLGTYLSLITTKSIIPTTNDPLLSTTTDRSFWKKQKKPALDLVMKPDTAFITKIIVNEYTPNIQQTNKFILFNIGRSFAFLDFMENVNDPISVAYFKDAYITCHDVNTITSDTTNVLVAVGFSTGDIICYQPLNGRYARMNKNGCIHKWAVTAIRWMPGQENTLVAGFDDGSLLVFENGLEDQNYPIPQCTSPDFLVSKPPKDSRVNPRSYWKVAKMAVTG